MFYTAVFVVYAGNISTANILMLIFCLYLLISVKYLVSIISIFAALNNTFIVNISILFTFMFLKIRILFHNIPISFTFMFHDIWIQIKFTRWIYDWRQGYAQSRVFIFTLSTFPLKLLAHINFFLVLFLPFVRWNKMRINYKVLLNWLKKTRLHQPSKKHERLLHFNNWPKVA